jgi:hypothetical protein
VKEKGVSMQRFADLPSIPGISKTIEEQLTSALPLVGTPGHVYVERRGVAVDVAAAAGVRFAANFGGRPAVLVAMRNHEDTLVAVHGRYLHTIRGQNKMLTIGLSGGMVSVLSGWRAEPLILVEGLFDALSLATCGWAAVATIGRWAPWLPEVSAGRVAWLAFDASRPGESDVTRYAERLRDADVRRLPPPPHCKDWNTALVKCGRSGVTRWIRGRLTAGDTASQKENPAPD